MISEIKLVQWIEEHEFRHGFGTGPELSVIDADHLLVVIDNKELDIDEDES